MVEEFTSSVKGVDLTITVEDIKEAFNQTQAEFNEYNYSPWHHIQIDGERKPVKDVFENIDQVEEKGLSKGDFTTNDAERFLENLDVQLFNVKENSGSLFIDTLKEILGEYDPQELGRLDNDKRVYKLIEEKGPALLKHLAEKASDNHRFKIETLGSAGQGNWASIPWISIRNKEGKSMENGTNPVFLIDPSEDKVYLTLNQKVQRENGQGNRTNSDLKEKGQEMREKYELEGFEPGPLQLDAGGIGGKYGPATVYYKEYSAGSIDEEELEQDVSNITNLFLRNIEQSRGEKVTSSDKDNPQLFLAPCSNDDAYSHLRDTVIRRVPTNKIWKFSPKRDFDHDVISVWGNREGTSSSWEQIEAGDFLLFYRQGEYIYGAEIIDTEENRELAEELWPDDDGDPWKYIIYLKEPFKLDLSQNEINDLAGYSENYNLMGFQSLNDEGIDSIEERYGEVREFLKEKKTGPASPETSFIDYDMMGDTQTVEGYGPDSIRSSVSPDEDLNVELDESLVESNGLFFPENQEEEIVRQIEAALNSGKHIIFTGPPGTGKTEIAEAVAEELYDSDSNVTGYQMTTATADWSTFDTVGGFMPEKDGDGDLEFNPGQILNRFRDDQKDLKNEVLVIDEINRSDIDKAFGQLFTLLSGQEVQLPYTADNGREIEVIPGEKAPENLGVHQYLKPESWRILATMNSYDKTSLYEMSYAFMRRFAFIRVEAPDSELNEHIREYSQRWNIDADDSELDAVADVWERINSDEEGRKIGPAIAEDMLGSVAHDGRDLEQSLTNAVVNYVFPQLEGVRNNGDIVRKIAKSDEVNGDDLREVARDMLQVKFDEEK